MNARPSQPPLSGRSRRPGPGRRCRALEPGRDSSSARGPDGPGSPRAAARSVRHRRPAARSRGSAPRRPPEPAAMRQASAQAIGPHGRPVPVGDDGAGPHTEGTHDLPAGPHGGVLRPAVRDDVTQCCQLIRMQDHLVRVSAALAGHCPGGMSGGRSGADFRGAAARALTFLRCCQPSCADTMAVTSWEMVTLPSTSMAPTSRP